MIRLVTITLLSFILTSRCSLAFAADTVGAVTGLTGVANIERGGAEFAAALSMPIQIHDRLITIGKAQLTVTFHDGSKLIVSETGTYSIDQYAMTSTTRTEASISLWAGHLRAIVNIGVGGVPDFFSHLASFLHLAAKCADRFGAPTSRSK